MSSKVAVAVVGFLLLIPLAIAMIGGQSDRIENSSGISKNVPSEYAEFVQAAGEICDGITPSLIATQIDAESGWNPNAHSPAGAQGISQFMPGTWLQYGRDGNGDGRADVHEPADAIISQGHMMCANLAAVEDWIASGEVSGDPIDLALAAYNAGPGAVRNFGGVPPFPETVAYVDKIRTGQAQYLGVATGGREDVIAWARSQIGKPYRGEGPGPGCGSLGPNCWDCCGFASGAYEAVGVTLPMSTPGNPPHLSRCEYAIYSRYSEYGGQRFEIAADYSNLAPGDLVFFHDQTINPDYDYVTHVAISLGGNRIIDASPGGGVQERTIYTGRHQLLPYAVRITE